MRLTNGSRRAAAIKRGMAFICQSARDPQNFELYGHDYLCCFYCIAATSRDAELRLTARRAGQERARVWRRQQNHIPRNVDANGIAELIMGSDAADRLGVRDRTFKARLRKTAGDFTALEYFGFDPAREPPPNNLPEDCECEADNLRGCTICRSCGRSLDMKIAYWVWLNAITLSYTAQRSAVNIGTPFKEVLQWLPAMRDYPECDDPEDPDLYGAIYAVTHVVYALNDYSLYRLSPTWLPNEYEFLKRSLAQSVATEDPEMMGELMDTLKSFGLSDAHPLIRKGTRQLLAQQNTDGSWGDPEAEDVYERYHPTWTAIDGLRDYAWQGQRLSLRRLAPLVRRFADRQCASRASSIAGTQTDEPIPRKRRREPFGVTSTGPDERFQ